MRWLLTCTLFAAIGCNKSDSPRAASSTTADLSVGDRVSRGWQSRTDGFVPDNSDVVAQQRAILQARAARDGGADEEEAEEQPLVILAGKDRRELGAKDFAALGEPTGERKSFSLADVIAHAFPKKKFKTVVFVDKEGGKSSVPLAAITKDRDGYSVRFNRRGSARVQMPEGAATDMTHKPEHGRKGEGVSRQRKSKVDHLELQ